MIIVDEKLGRINLHVNARAQRVIFRCRGDVLNCTVPPYVSADDVLKLVSQKRAELLALKEREQQRGGGELFGPKSRICTDDFEFRCVQNEELEEQVDFDLHRVTFYYNHNVDWSSPKLQSWLTQTVEGCMRTQCGRVLLPRLEELAWQRGLHYNKATIRKTKSRWGSCSGQGNINLSLYLLLLPPHLRDYIMHHELTHLLEMNHGPRFHALLNEATGGRSQLLRAELRQYTPSLRLQ